MINWLIKGLGGSLGPYIVVGAASVLAVFAAYQLGHHNGWKAHEAKVAADTAQAVKQIAKREVKAQAITNTVATKTEQTRIEIRYRTQTLIQKVPVYVPASADAACVLPTGFVQLHDAAAAGLPGPSGGPDQTPSGVPLSDALETIVGNYGAAYDWRAEALAWRDWYPKVRAAYEGR
jgi:hypothetical protein